MNDATYNEWIASLPDDTRLLVQHIMARVGALLNSRYNSLHEDLQRTDRRQATNSGRIAELNLRLDQYEDRQWSAAKEAIEQFAATQLPATERDELIQVLYNLARDVEALKAKAAGDAEQP